MNYHQQSGYCMSKCVPTCLSAAILYTVGARPYASTACFISSVQRFSLFSNKCIPESNPDRCPYPQDGRVAYGHEVINKWGAGGRGEPCLVGF